MDLSYFPRQNTEPTIPPEEKEKFCKTKITNFPKDLSDSDALVLLNDNVDKSIKADNIKVIRNNINSQIILGPGQPNL